MAVSGGEPSTSAIDLSPLTAHERVVLASAATGRSTHEIAEHLGLSPDVVRATLGSARVRLGARSKLETVLIAARMGQFD
jgi:DNA-binding CsgD family transcriptional regulator